MIGHDPGVKRFVKGHLYWIVLRRPDHFFIGRFCGMMSTKNRVTKRHYLFVRIADNRNFPFNTEASHYALILRVTMKNYQIEEITRKDLPLYIHTKNLTKEFDRILNEDRPSKRKLSKRTCRKRELVGHSEM